MSVQIQKQSYKRLFKSALPDEQYCLICLKNLEEENDLFSLFIEQDVLCCACRKQFKEHKKVYSIQGIDVHVLYEYTEELENLFFQFKEQRDIVLAKIFLFPYREKICRAVRSYVVCGLCSSDEKYMERLFIPLEEMFNSLSIPIYFPLYKTVNIKQSKQGARARKDINQYILKKTCYPMPNRKIILVDDVCTTGASLETGIHLLNPDVVFLISAHPLWIQDNKKNEQVEKKALFW